MSSGVFKGNASGTGVVTLETPNTNSDITIALPARAGNLMMDGPAFSAYASATQTLAATTFTKLQANTKEFDTNNNYDTTNYRFTPTVAGYYQITGGCAFSTTQTAELLITIYKNGARFKTVFDMEATSWGGYGTALVYANGTTDYFELYIYTASSGTKVTATGARDSYFSASFVRGA